MNESTSAGVQNAAYVETNDDRDPAVPPLDPNNPLVGYENVGVTDTEVRQVPKTDTRVNAETSQPRDQFQDVPILTEDEAKKALLEYVNSKCCYGKTPVMQMSMTDIQSSNSYRYLLQTFHEIRSTQWLFEPYHGQPIYNNGMPPPMVWDIQVQPKALFQKEKVKLEVPNTAFVKTCHSCHGRGSHTCTSCGGCGRTSCSSCGGSGRTMRHENGHTHHHTCTSCGGSGRRSCWSCHGTGRRQCTKCRGSGRVKWYIELTVKFETKVDDFIKKSEDIPDDKIRNCQSVSTFAEQNPRVFAINHHHDQDINKASFTLIQAHLLNLHNARILMQAQVVFAIPVTLCKYKFKEKDYQYQIYGLDKKIHAPDYAHKCCCCCSIS